MYKYGVYIYILVYIYIYIYICRNIKIPQTDLSEGVLTVLLGGLDCAGAPLTAAGQHLSLYKMRLESSHVEKTIVTVTNK